MELGSLVRLTYRAQVISGAYSKVDRSESGSENDSAAAIIQYLLHGKMAEGQESEKYASEAVSVTQMFAEAAAGITEKLERMRELAEEAGGEPSKKKLEQLQEEFAELAGEINEIVENTEHNGNKLLGSEGRTISVSIGNGSSIEIVGNDLRIDIEGLDLTSDAERALSDIESELSEASYYSGYLADQVWRLESSMGLIEFEAENDLGIEADEDEFDMEQAKEVAGYASSRSVEELLVLFDAQANAEGDRALQLLRDSIEQAAQAEEEEDTE